MAAIFRKVADGVPCRACGAVLAAAHPNEYGLCDNCWTMVEMSCGVNFDMRRRGEHRRDVAVSSEDVNAWLTRKLMLDVKRLSHTGIVGRCEAVSGWAYGIPGTQCAKGATEYRGVHKVCYRHARATAPVFVSDRQSDQYQMLRDILAELANKDERFAAIVREIAA